MGLPVQAAGGGCLSPSIVIENLAKNIYNPEVRASVLLLSTIETISGGISPRCHYLTPGCLLQSLGQASIFCFFSLFPVFRNPPFLHAHLAEKLTCPKVNRFLVLPHPNVLKHTLYIRKCEILSVLSGKCPILGSKPRFSGAHRRVRAPPRAVKFKPEPIKH